jgi:origin recognition complex subunit 2
LEAKFQRWQCLLLEGFSLLLYGLGTKAELLNSLRKFLASNEDDAIVVNGFFPSLTLREVSLSKNNIG